MTRTSWLRKLLPHKEKMRPPLRRRPLEIEWLEDRTVLTTNITAESQLMVELINRARANPLAEAARLGVGLNEGLAPGTISSAPSQPLAVNQQLINAINAHLNYLFSNNVGLSHIGAGGSSLGGRASAAGYPWTALAENLAIINRQPGYNDSTGGVNFLHELLFVDAGYPGRGHRVNLLNGVYKEIGAGTLVGSYPFAGFANTSYLVGQDFGTRAGNSFFTGVVITDAIVRDNFYTIGEGVGGAVITATRISDNAVFTAVTGGAGGYSIQLPPGTYNVTASGGPLTAARTVTGITVGTQNVKVDFNLADTAVAPPPAAGPLSELSAVGDFNGDGRDDVARLGEDGAVHVFVSTGTSFVDQIWASWSDRSFWDNIYAGDFNGDGRDDIAGFSESGGWYVGISTGSGFLTTFWAGWSEADFWYKFVVGDFNGDGRDDVAGIAHNGQWYVGASTGCSFLASLWAGWSDSSMWYAFIAGDFNGDGRDDVAGFAHNGSWFVGLSTGSTFLTTYWAGWSDSSMWFAFEAGDFNADGIDDIVGFAHNGTWFLGHSNGSTLFTGPMSIWSDSSFWQGIFVGDFNGDGRADGMGISNSGVVYVGLYYGTFLYTSQWA